MKKVDTRGNQDIEGFRVDLRDIKLKLEHLTDEVAVKSNIKDVCALVDLKSNSDEVDKEFDNIYHQL
jgi:hypothetical protein